MQRFWHLLTLLLLALMLPASVCCWVPMNECHACEGECAPVPCDEAPVLPDACPSDTLAHSQAPVLLAVPAMQVFELADIIHAMMRLNERAVLKAAPVPLMTNAPPELRVTWVFVSRAALPARAPSERA